MNRYRQMARKHWARWLPAQYAAIEDPTGFFSDLGNQAGQRIDQLADQLAGDGPPGEDYLAKAGRLGQARIQAEEIVLADLILLPPESGTDEDQDPPTAAENRPEIVTRDHPAWELVAEDHRLRTQGE